MDIAQAILDKLRVLPLEQQQEVLHYAEFLDYRRQATATSLLDERQARRKANRWLLEYVGNLVGAYDGVRSERDNRPVWRFGAFITSRAHPPRGPIGYVEVDTMTGEVLTEHNQAEDMIARGEQLATALPPSAG